MSEIEKQNMVTMRRCLSILAEGTAQERIARYLVTRGYTEAGAAKIMDMTPALRNDMVRINVINAVRDYERRRDT